MDMDGISAAADSLAKEFAEQKVLLEREMRLREVLKVRTTKERHENDKQSINQKVIHPCV